MRSSAKGHSRRFTGMLRSSGRTVAIWGIWSAAAVFGVWLYVQAPEFTAVRGIAEVIEYHVTARTAERVLDVPVLVGQRVRKGELVAVLDPAEVSREWDVAQAELERAESEWRAQQQLISRERLTEEQRFATDVDRAEVDLLQDRMATEQTKADLDGVRTRIQRWQSLVRNQVAATDTLENLKVEATVLERRSAAQQRNIAAKEQRLQQIRRRLSDYQAAAPSAKDGDPLPADLLAPYQSAVAICKARLQQLEERRSRLNLLAPDDAVVAQIRLQPGDVATPGSAILILRAAKPTRVLTYPNDVQARRLQLGSPAVVTLRDGSGRRIAGKVTSLGAGMVAEPEQLLNDSRVHSWGREVIVSLSEPADLAPGQILDVRFQFATSGGNESVAAPTRVADAMDVADPRANPQPVGVPPTLKAMSRLEPSALLWSERQKRFLVASDDTGWPDRQDHAPWLFRMDAAGQFDPTPALLDGIDKINDIEAMAPAADDTFYLLSSQSASQRGNRPQSRTRLLKVAMQQDGLHVLARASLIEALAGLPEEQRQQLGLTTPDLRIVENRKPDKEPVFDRLLNIEGLTGDGQGGLWLGLKQPLGADGAALIWRLSEPEAFLQSGRLQARQLTLFARISLTAGPGGRPLPAGISDLLRLRDGSLLVLATALGAGLEGPDDDQRQNSGALYHVAAPTNGGTLVATRIRDFPGIKPEGMAIGPSADRLTVIFDQGSSEPLFLQMPVPPPLANGATAR